MEDLNRHSHCHCLVMGDINRHSPSWGYKDLNVRGEPVKDWMIDKTHQQTRRQAHMSVTSLEDYRHTRRCHCLSRHSKDVHKKCRRLAPGCDYLPVLLQLSLSYHTGIHCKKPSRNYKKADWASVNSLKKTCARNTRLKVPVTSVLMLHSLLQQSWKQHSKAFQGEGRKTTNHTGATNYKTSTS